MFNALAHLMRHVRRAHKHEVKQYQVAECMHYAVRHYRRLEREPHRISEYPDIWNWLDKWFVCVHATKAEIAAVRAELSRQINNEFSEELDTDSQADTDGDDDDDDDDDDDNNR